MDELDQRHLDHVGIAQQRGRGGLQLAHICMVVRAERIELALEAPPALVDHIGEVGGQIGGLAVGPHHHPVLVVAEGGRAHPYRALGAVDVALGV